MNKSLFLSFLALTFTVSGNAQKNESQEKENNAKQGIVYTNRPDKKTKELRKMHKRFLAKSPFKKTLKMSKNERIAYGLPPNKYFERMWELSMDPSTGKIYPEKVSQLQEKMANNRLSQRAPGDGATNAWVERGPNNVGGRTRALLFDPNDATRKKVYAGSASGGLWVNNDITTNTGWTRVSGVPSNLNVSCIVVDPNNSNIWYLGTGEQYTFGDAVGTGLYKTTDGGSNWTKVPITFTGTNFTGTTGNLTVAGIFYIHDIVARNNAGTTEIYVGVGSHIYGSANSPLNFNGSEQTGLYKSTNGGTTWTRNTDANMVNIVSNGRTFYEIPNDLELDANNNIWFSTTRIPGIGLNTAKIYKSTDGNTWTIAQTIANARRTEIEPSSSNANKMYVLYEGVSPAAPVNMLVTTNAFTSTTTITLPDDVDTGIPANDFTRGQAFYDLVVESDPTNDAIVYIGGIDLFRSTNSGSSWSQISKWSNNNNLAALRCSLVHADQHVITFRPGFPNQAVIGNDGGVYYATSLSTAATNNVIPSRILNYNVTQFYSIGVAPTNSVSGLTGDYFLAGAQDNGTQYFANPSTTVPEASTLVQDGDGAYSFFDQGADRYFISNFVYNQSIRYRTTAGTSRTINSESTTNGDFICPMALDSNLDRLYTDYTTGSTYQIRRYSNLKSGTVRKAILSNALLTNNPTALRVSKYTLSSSTLLVGTADSKVLLITNANATTPTWTNITGSGFVGSVSDVEFGQNENQIFVTFHNYGVTSVWYSNDKGVTWGSIEGDFPDIPVKCILQNPLNSAELIIGTDLGVWNAKNFNPNSASTQALTWNQSYNGMSDVKVLDLQLRNDNKVFAATYGRGIFSGNFSAAVNRENNEVSEDNFDELIKVYPTVVKGENISIKSNGSLGQTEINLFDLTGKKVYSNTISLDGSEQNLNIGSLNSGIFIMKISTSNYEDSKQIIIE